MGIKMNPAVQAAIERAEREGRVHDPAAVAAQAAAAREAAMPTPAEEAQAEKAFQAEVVKFAKAHRWRVYHTHDSRKSAAGYPDLCMVRQGRIVYAELKTATGTTTAAQYLWLEDLRAVEDEAALARGVPIIRVFLWRPSDWPQIQEVLA